MAVTQSQLGPQKLSSVCEEKNERGNATKKLVITSGISNTSAWIIHLKYTFEQILQFS